jgi:hypothetical protein
VVQQGVHVSFTCQPDSPTTRAEGVAFWQATGGMAAYEGRHWHGRWTEVPTVRSRNDVCLRRGNEALSRHWLELPVVNATTGEPLSPHSGITQHRLTADTGGNVAHVSRGRWQIENDTNNVLKTKGDHLEHTCGHGQQSLAAFLRRLTRLAFLCHTVLEWSDDKYALRRRVLARRPTFFQDIQA